MRDFDPTASEFITSGYIETSRPGGKYHDPATAAVVGIGGSLVNGIMGSDASQNAADTQAASADKANALQKEMFDKQVELQAPFREAGLAGQNRMLQLLGLSGDPSAPGYGSLTKNFSMQDFQQDPGYQFRMDEGLKAVERGSAASGMLGSGRYLKDLTRFGQGQASQEYGNAFNRFQTNRANTLNPLQALLGQGQSASNNMAGNAGSYGANVGQNIIGAGNAQAAGQIGSANALNNALGSGWNMYSGNRLMNQYLGGGGNNLQAAFSGTGLGGSGFGTGLAYGNQDYGQYL